GDVGDREETTGNDEQGHHSPPGLYGTGAREEVGRATLVGPCAFDGRLDGLDGEEQGDEESNEEPPQPGVEGAQREPVERSQGHDRHVQVHPGWGSRDGESLRPVSTRAVPPAGKYTSRSGADACEPGGISAVALAGAACGPPRPRGRR